MSEHVHEATDSTGVLGWVLNNRLKAIGYTWLAGVGGSLVSLSLCVGGSCSECGVLPRGPCVLSQRR